MSNERTGIILYRIIRGVFVDCGWEFAAIAGVKAGLLLEAAVFCAGLLFFEGIGEKNDEEKNTILLCAIGAGLTTAGNCLSVSFSLLSDIPSGVIGMTAQEALLILALLRCAKNSRRPALTDVLLFSAVCVFAAGAAVMAAESIFSGNAPVAAPFFSMLGISAIITLLAERSDVLGECSAWGFAFGVMVSYVSDSLIR